MKKKYHIDDNGNPAVCKAVVRACPRGDSPHGKFDSPHEARVWSEAILAKEYAEKTPFKLPRGLKSQLYSRIQKEKHTQNPRPDGFSTFAGSDVTAMWEHLNKESYWYGYGWDGPAYKEFREAFNRRVAEGVNYDPSSKSFEDIFEDIRAKAIEDGTDAYLEGEEGTAGIRAFFKTAMGTASAKEREKLKQLPLDKYLVGSIRSASYDRWRAKNPEAHAEPSNVLRIISDKNPRVKILKSKFPYLGRLGSPDKGKFSVDDLTVYYKSHGSSVNFGIRTKTGKTYTFKGVAYGGRDLEKLIERGIVDNPKALEHLAETGEGTTSFTKHLAESEDKRTSAGYTSET